MRENMDKVLERDAKLSDLEDRSGIPPPHTHSLSLACAHAHRHTHSLMHAPCVAVIFYLMIIIIYLFHRDCKGLVLNTLLT